MIIVRKKMDSNMQRLYIVYTSVGRSRVKQVNYVGAEFLADGRLARVTLTPRPCTQLCHRPCGVEGGCEGFGYPLPEGARSITRELFLTYYMPVCAF
jgi:hypothetical protein